MADHPLSSLLAYVERQLWAQRKRLEYFRDESEDDDTDGYVARKLANAEATVRKWEAWVKGSRT